MKTPQQLQQNLNETMQKVSRALTHAKQQLESIQKQRGQRRGEFAKKLKQEQEKIYKAVNVKVNSIMEEFEGEMEKLDSNARKVMEQVTAKVDKIKQEVLRESLKTKK